MSPTLLRKEPYRVYIYSHDCNEPRHVHVDRENKSAKFWLDPVVILAVNYGYSRAELRQIESILTEELDLLRERWYDFCGGHSGAS
jgi:hypothetical protein